jgi:hypothetical protein
VGIWESWDRSEPADKERRPIPDPILFAGNERNPRTDQHVAGPQTDSEKKSPAQDNKMVPGIRWKVIAIRLIIISTDSGTCATSSPDVSVRIRFRVSR